MTYLVELMITRNGELVNPCGSGYSVFIHDLKTVKGILNRIKRWYIPKDVEEIHIYRCSEFNMYSEDKRTLVYKGKHQH